MDLLSLAIGIVLGLAIGFVVAWTWSASVSKAKRKANNVTEAQLKALLAQQAQSHLQHSRASIEVIEKELKALHDSVNNYEHSLQNTDEDVSGTTFFGEHASLFLRNANIQAPKASAEATTEDQPRDFANNGSGLFVGTPEISANKDAVVVSKE